MYRFDLERDELAERLGGGIPRGTLVVLEGEYGAGKSIVLQRLTYGLLKNGHSMSYVSTESTTLQFVEQMHSLGYPVEEYLLDHRMLFLPVYPLMGFRGTKPQLMDRLLKAKRMYESDVVAIDTFSSLVKNWHRSLPPTASHSTVMDKLEDAFFLFKLLNAKGKTVILTLQPGELPSDFEALLKAAADVYVNLRFSVVGNNVNRSILVRRFGRSAQVVGDVVNFKVEPKAGLIVEIKSVS